MTDNVSRNLSETEQKAQDFINTLIKKGPQGQATVVALSGDLGAGKTAFVQAATFALGVKESVTSPTFVIQNVYNINIGGFSRCIHIDAYRLKSAQELMSLGWKELIENSQHIIFIEWPERVVECIPPAAIKIQFDHVSEGERSIHIRYE